MPIPFYSLTNSISTILYRLSAHNKPAQKLAPVELCCHKENCLHIHKHVNSQNSVLFNSVNRFDVSLMEYKAKIEAIATVTGERDD